MTAGDANPLFFSIVVPTRNRPRELAALLEALAAQSFPPNRFEIVLVDDGSDSPLDAAVAPFRDRLSIKLLRQHHAGPANARQRGIGAARGANLAFTDDDCRPAPHWLAALERCCLLHPGAAVGGKMINGLGNNAYSEASQLVINYLTDYSNADPARATYFPTSNLAFPARAYRAAVGLDQRWSISGGEDRDLCRRWVAGGHPMVYCSQAEVYHYHRLGFRSFCRQHFHYGRGAFRFRYLTSAGRWSRLKLEPWRFYVRLPREAFRRLGWTMACRVTPLLALSQIANAAGFLWEAIRTVVFRRQEELAFRPELRRSRAPAKRCAPGAR